MINHNRRKKLLKLLAQHRHIDTCDLPGLLATSLASVRRDIIWLAERNLVRRRHGGVAAADYMEREASGAYQRFLWSQQQNSGQKRAIALAAARMCNDGDAIVIGGGSTTLLMADFLCTRKLKVLTNSFLLASRLLVHGDSEIVLVGGVLNRAQNVILSSVEQGLATYHNGAKTFIGVHAIDEMGLLEENPAVLESQQRLIAHAGKSLIVLADSAKLFNPTGMMLCPLSRVAMVITDSAVPASVLRMLQSQGIAVVIVDADGAA